MDTQIETQSLSLPEGPPAEAPTVVSDAEAGGSSGVAVLSDEDVALMMRQLRNALSRVAEETATCDSLRDKLHQELAMIEDHERKVTKADRDHIAYLEQQLTAHLLNVRAADDRVKSIDTPWGRISSREQQPEFQRDEATVLAWAEGTPFARTRPLTTLDWKALKEHCHVRDGWLVTPEGEVVPGVEVVERPLKVDVEVYE